MTARCLLRRSHSTNGYRGTEAIGLDAALRKIVHPS